jgi:hypothetical protein
MMSIRDSGYFRLLAFVIVIALTHGCTSWKWKDQPSEQVLEKLEKGESIRVTRFNGTQVLMTNYLVRADTLFDVTGSVGKGELVSPDSIALGEIRSAVALSDIQSIEVQHADPGETVLLVLGLGALALLVAVVIAGIAYESQQSGGSSSSSGNGDYTSCPRIESWDGSQWHLDSGTFAGSFLKHLARTDVDNLPHASAAEGVVLTRVFNAVNETDYLDAYDVLAVDHDTDCSISPDADGNLHAYRDPISPVEARDSRGKDALPRLRELDNWLWESSVSGRDPNVDADIRDGVILEFDSGDISGEARLILDGKRSTWVSILTEAFINAHGQDTESWYTKVNDDPDATRKLGERLFGEASLDVSIWNGQEWESRGRIMSIGPEMTKTVVVPLGALPSQNERLRVRLESVPSFWQIDRAAIDFGPEGDFSVMAIEAENAVDWNSADVRAQLREIDGDHVVMQRGDTVYVEFRVPAPAAGKERSYLARTSGWYKINAPGDVEPDLASLQRLLEEPLGVSRMAVEQANDVLGKLSRPRQAGLNDSDNSRGNSGS